MLNLKKETKTQERTEEKQAGCLSIKWIQDAHLVRDLRNSWINVLTTELCNSFASQAFVCARKPTLCLKKKVKTITQSLYEWWPTFHVCHKLSPTSFQTATWIPFHCLIFCCAFWSPYPNLLPGFLRPTLSATVLPALTLTFCVPCISCPYHLCQSYLQLDTPGLYSSISIAQFSERTLRTTRTFH